MKITEICPIEDRGIVLLEDHDLRRKFVEKFTVQTIVLITFSGSGAVTSIVRNQNCGVMEVGPPFFGFVVEGFCHVEIGRTGGNGQMEHSTDVVYIRSVRLGQNMSTDVIDTATMRGYAH